MRVIRPVDGVAVGFAPTPQRDREVLRRVGHGMAAELVAELTGTALGQIVIEARCPRCGGDHGRPAVIAPSAATRVGVSVTHTGGFTIAAAALSRSIGVDAEPWVLEAGRVAAIEATAGLAPDDAPAVRHWTRVEAVLKADGRGLEVAADGIRFTADAHDPSRLTAVVPDRAARYLLIDLDADDRLCATLAIASEST